MTPLAGIRVLDLSRVLAGPWATQLLADLGAEIIKVEHPAGDETRGWGPPWFEGGGYREAAYFMAANRGKQSLAVDFSTPQGQEIIRSLAADCDVVVENFKTGGLARYGLDAATLCERNPRLVYCSITGFGQGGPRAEQPGYDFVIQGMSGLMSITGHPDGPPTKAGVALTDVLTGLYASSAILSALIGRQASGAGAHVEVSLFDVQLAALANQALNYLATGDNPGRLGNAHPNIVPYQSFAAADGSLTVAVGNDAQFARLCDVLGVADLASDPNFATNAARVANRTTLTPLLSAEFARRPVADWVTALEAAGIPGGAINSIALAFADPQARERGVVTPLSHPKLGPAPSVACPIRVGDRALGTAAAPPMIGEHSRQLLRRRLALSDDQIASLEQAGVVACVGGD